MRFRCLEALAQKFGLCFYKYLSRIWPKQGLNLSWCDWTGWEGPEHDISWRVAVVVWSNTCIPSSYLIFDHTSKYFCFKIPTFCFWLEALIPCLPHSFTSIFALKHPGISTRNICRLKSWNTCVETGRGWSGFCEPYWWSLQLLVWR